MKSCHKNSRLKFMGVIIALLLLSTSCLTFFRATVNYMKPAELNIPGEIKTIALLTSGNSEYHDEMYTILLNVFGKEAVKARYELIDRQNLTMIMQEQNFYNSDDFDDNTIVEIGNLAGAGGIIIGGFNNVSETTTNAEVVIVRRYAKKYIDDEGNERTKYVEKDEEVPSVIKTYRFTIDLRMIDIERGTILHNDNKEYAFMYEQYFDKKPDNYVYLKDYNVNSSNVLRNKEFPPIETLLRTQGNSYGSGFAKMVAPYMVQVRMAFEIVPRDDINERFIKYVRNELYEEAHVLLLDNLGVINGLEKPSDKAKHYFNLGCTYEILNDLDTSKQFYEKAVREDPTTIHMESLKAIKDRINERKRLEKQLE